MAKPDVVNFPEYLTFDDVLLKPGASSVLPAEVATVARLTRTIELSIPIISAAMDTVTESRLAIAMAQLGGLGVIHRNMDPERQAERLEHTRVAETIAQQSHGLRTQAIATEIHHDDHQCHRRAAHRYRRMADKGAERGRVVEGHQGGVERDGGYRPGDG